MLENIESNYNCANASKDLHDLKQELADLQAKDPQDQASKEYINRLENQISFILNKCDINHRSVYE